MAGFGILQKGEGRVIISGQMECEGKQLTFVSKVVANLITYLPYTQKQKKKCHNPNGLTCHKPT